MLNVSTANNNRAGNLIARNFITSQGFPKKILNPALTIDGIDFVKNSLRF